MAESPTEGRATKGGRSRGQPVRYIQAQEVAPAERARAETAEAAPVAVVVCHGMGQQVPFATLADVAEAIRSAHDERQPKRESESSSVVEFAEVGGIQLPRARLRLGRPEPSSEPFKDREIHLYEAYWAEKTAGQITGRATLWFLLTAGANGLLFARRRRFRRWMFGGERDCALGASTMISLAIAVVVLVSLLAVTVAYGVIVFANVAVRFDRAWEHSTAITTLQPRFLATLLWIALASLLYVLVLWIVRRRSPVTWAANALYGAALCVTVIAAGVGSTYWMLKAWDAGGGSTPGLLQSLADWMLSSALVALADARATSLLGSYLDLFRPELSGPLAAARAVASLLFWVGFPAAFLLARYFLIEYLGDVAIYLSAHKVNRYAEVRQRIEEECARVARAVYAHDDGNGYGEVVVVGHSLGSVLAYDTINRLSRDEVARTPLAPSPVIERTPVLMTFGSPLDKIAFLFRAQATEVHERSALLAARQPLIRDYLYRPQRWVNIWTPYDWISGTLDYFDAPAAELPTERRKQLVLDVVDEEAYIPLVAHTGYWTSRVFRSKLYDCLQGRDPLATDPPGEQTHSSVGPVLMVTSER